MAKKKYNHQWERVTRTSMPKRQVQRQERNQKRLNSDKFVEHCEYCKIKPTKRQASKFNNQKGIVYKTFH